MSIIALPLRRLDSHVAGLEAQLLARNIARATIHQLTTAVATCLTCPCRQLVIAGCANGSCNPKADGGSSVSTSQNTQTTTVQQPAPADGGNPIIDLIGTLGPLLAAGGGRKLMGHQVATSDSTNMRQLK